jgi:hypothetical protein
MDSSRKRDVICPVDAPAPHRVTEKFLRDSAHACHTQGTANVISRKSGKRPSTRRAKPHAIIEERDE